MAAPTNDGTISLRFLREILAPTESTDFRAQHPVYLNVNGQLFEIADFSFVFGVGESHVEIQAGAKLTDREARATDRKVADRWEDLGGRR